MVKKKHISKRLPLHKKHAIEKKVKETHKKRAKEAKNNPQKRKKLLKDPGIPNIYPFKEELLQQIESHRARIAEEKLQEQIQRKKGGLSKDQLLNANQRVSAYEQQMKQMEEEQKRQQEQGLIIKDMSKRQFYKKFKHVVEASDVILEVLDIRDPLGCRCHEAEQLVTQAGSKKLVFVLNKIDLVPSNVVEQWISYLRAEHPTVAFKCTTQGKSHTRTLSCLRLSKGTAGNTCLGSDTLLQLLKNYARTTSEGGASTKTSVVVGVIGFPNVGKSSLVNSLKRSKAVGVSSTPGYTQVISEVRLDKQVKLLDCPGIVFAEDDGIALRSCLKIEQMEDPLRPIDAILARCNKKALLQHYKCADFNTANDLLSSVAQSRGKLSKGGIPNLEAAARIILYDWSSGRIPYWTLPPKREGVHLGASIVSNFSEELDLANSEVLGSLTRCRETADTQPNEDMAMDFEQDSIYDEYVLPNITSSIPITTTMTPAIDDSDNMVQEDTPLKIKKGRKAEPKEKSDTLVSQLNPQVNLQLRKQQKKAKRDAKRGRALPLETENQDYDFSTDFFQ